MRKKKTSQLELFIKEYKLVAMEKLQENGRLYIKPWVSLNKLIAEGEKQKNSQYLSQRREIKRWRRKKKRRS